MSYRSARKNAGFSVIEVAKNLGVSRAAVYQWEEGNADPTVGNLRKMMELYGCSADDLLRTAGGHVAED